MLSVQELVGEGRVAKGADRPEDVVQLAEARADLAVDRVVDGDEKAGGDPRPESEDGSGGSDEVAPAGAQDGRHQGRGLGEHEGEGREPGAEDGRSEAEADDIPGVRLDFRGDPGLDLR